MLRRVLVLAAVLSLATGGAFAQSPMTPLRPLNIQGGAPAPDLETAPIEGMVEAVRDWMDLSAREYAQVLRDRIHPCFVDAMGRMPPDIQDRVISARSFQAGLDAVGRTDPVIIDEFYRRSLPCRGALQIGEEIVAHIGETMPAATQDERDIVIGCMVDVIVILPIQAMERIYGAVDYPTGVRQAMLVIPELVGDLDVRLNACYPPGFAPPPTVRPITPTP